MLRPDGWLADRNVVKGESVYIVVPECGIDANAEVLNVEPCLEIAEGTGQVVTATYKHFNAQIIDVKIASEPAAIGSTPNHPFWSEDKQKFVRADELNLNERVRTLSGTSVVELITKRPGRHTVYNLEVKGEHVYHVGTGGVLVHNAVTARCDDVVEQLVNGTIRRTNKTGAGAARTPRHHIFSTSISNMVR